MGNRTWPGDWEERRGGRRCPACAEGRPAATETGVRFFSGTHADAYLQRRSRQPGYSVVVWRGRHVVDPTLLDAAEGAGYWADLAAVARAIERCYSPCHLNFQILGNRMPHLHTHLVPRYVDDSEPERPVDPDGPPIDPADLARQVARLKSTIALSPPPPRVPSTKPSPVPNPVEPGNGEIAWDPTGSAGATSSAGSAWPASWVGRWTADDGKTVTIEAVRSGFVITVAPGADAAPYQSSDLLDGASKTIARVPAHAGRDGRGRFLEIEAGAPVFGPIYRLYSSAPYGPGFRRASFASAQEVELIPVLGYTQGPEDVSVLWAYPLLPLRWHPHAP